MAAFAASAGVERRLQRLVVHLWKGPGQARAVHPLQCLPHRRARAIAAYKVFDLAGIDPLTGRRFWVHLTMPLDATLLDFLLLVMNCPDAPMTMRLDAAKTAAKLMHEPPKPVVTVTRNRRRRSSVTASSLADDVAADE